MKIFILITGGRTGSGFLHSILDGHSEICQFPGEFFFDEFFEIARDEKDDQKIAKLFCNNYKFFFDSRINKFERFDKLGVNKNEFFKVNKKEFINNFKRLHSKSSRKKLDLLENLHLAYSKTNKENFKKKKVILLHLHHIFRLPKIQDLNYEILYTVRDPKTNLSSFFTSWSKYKKKIIDPWSYFFNINRVVNGLNELHSFKRKIHIIKLEDMHHQNKNVLLKLCKIIKIRFEKIMFFSTFRKKKWWGDMSMKEFLNGANKNFKNKHDENLFFIKDIYFIEKVLKRFMSKNNYQFYLANKKINFLNILLPFKMEIIILIFNLKRINLIGFSKIFYYYLKRVLLFLRLSINQSKT